MTNAGDHGWDLHEGDKGYLPECDEAYEKKFEEWQARDWPDWLAKHLTFPFTVTREEDEDDPYFAPGAAKAPFRLGHKMDVLELAEEDVDRGGNGQGQGKRAGRLRAAADMEVTPKTNANFWPVREYVVWFANRC
jgi:hypothetical protein